MFAGRPDAPNAAGDYAANVSAQIRTGGFGGRMSWLDTDMGGSLGDLAEARDDLALIALPNDLLAKALEVAGRIRCRAALIVSAGIDVAAAALGTLAR